MTTYYTNPRAGMHASVAVTTSDFTHPDHKYWSPVWSKIRDAEIGEVQIKAKAQAYLPKLAGHDNEQYLSFLNRAVFYNMTAKTLNALYGSLFRRPAKVTGLPKKMGGITRRFTKDGASLHIASKIAAKEVLTTGRYGLLVDADPRGAYDPYVVPYVAENIVDWDSGEIDGEWKVTRVVLREVEFDRSPDAGPNEVRTVYRVLYLAPGENGWEYSVAVFADRTGSGLPDLDGMPDREYVPTVRGRPLKHIPFVFCGAFANVPDCAKPPLLDIVTLNFSHYQSYATLEQGRFYTANPVYTVSSGTAGDENGEYYVSADLVWELGKDGKAEILEFKGHGLRSLEIALDQKEAQIAAIGGRMLAANAGPGESDNALKMREANEQSLLLNVSDCVDDAFTTVLRWLADWKNVPEAAANAITFEVYREFQTKESGARELRAIHQMYEAGVIPLRVVYEFLIKADVIPDWVDYEEYEASLSDPKSFPNQQDVIAKMQGFPDAASWHEYRMQTGVLQ